MVIFHSYVSLPEGTLSEFIHLPTGFHGSMGFKTKRGDEYDEFCTFPWEGVQQGRLLAQMDRKKKTERKKTGELLSDDQYDFNMWIRSVNELRCSTFFLFLFQRKQRGDIAGPWMSR